MSPAQAQSKSLFFVDPSPNGCDSTFFSGKVFALKLILFQRILGRKARRKVPAQTYKHQHRLRLELDPVVVEKNLRPSPSLTTDDLLTVELRTLSQLGVRNLRCKMALTFLLWTLQSFSSSTMLAAALICSANISVVRAVALLSATNWRRCRKSTGYKTSSQVTVKT